MNNINYEDFKNICRTCLSNSGVKFNQDSIISDVYHKLTDIPFEINEDLPKQICLKCFEKINEIHAFSLQCKRTHFALMNCVNNYKNIRINESVIKRKDEHEIEFVDVPGIKLKIKEENTESNEDDDSIKNFPELNEDSSNSNVFPLNSSNEEEHSGEHPSTTDEPKKIPKTPFQCNQCAKSFTQLSHLIIHVRVHSGEQPYKCDQCDKSFKCTSNLTAHKRLHSGERPYKCDLCPKSFNHSSHLTSHKRAHSGERPFQCDQCTKSFTRSDNLKIHKRVHSGEQPFKCDECEKTFTQSGHLVVHKRVHSGERPYKCDECEKSFIRPDYLITHKLVHSGEHPYKCDQCPKSFTVSSVLTRHKRVHRFEHPFKCDYCQKSFPELSKLTRHKRLHRGEHHLN